MANVFPGEFITVTTAGASITTSGTSARVAIPNNSAGELPRYIRVAASAAASVRLGGNTINAATTDTQVQPGDAVIMSTNNMTFLAEIGRAHV